MSDHPLEAPTDMQRIHGTNGHGGPSRGNLKAEAFTYFADAGTEGRLRKPLTVQITGEGQAHQRRIPWGPHGELFFSLWP